MSISVIHVYRYIYIYIYHLYLYLYIQFCLAHISPTYITFIKWPPQCLGHTGKDLDLPTVVCIWYSSAVLVACQNSSSCRAVCRQVVTHGGLPRIESITRALSKDMTQCTATLDVRIQIREIEINFCCHDTHFSKQLKEDLNNFSQIIWFTQ